MNECLALLQATSSIHVHDNLVVSQSFIRLSVIIFIIHRLSELSWHITICCIVYLSVIPPHGLKELFRHDNLGIACPSDALIFLRRPWIHGYHLVKALCLSKLLIQFLHLLVWRRRSLMIVGVVLLGLTGGSVTGGGIGTSSAWECCSFNLLVGVSGACCHLRSIWWFDESFRVWIVSTRVWRWNVVLECWNYFLIVSNFLLKPLNVLVVLSFQVFHLFISLVPL